MAYGAYKLLVIYDRQITFGKRPDRFPGAFKFWLD